MSSNNIPEFFSPNTYYTNTLLSYPNYYSGSAPVATSGGGGDEEELLVPFFENNYGAPTGAIGLADGFSQKLRVCDHHHGAVPSLLSADNDQYGNVINDVNGNILNMDLHEIINVDLGAQNFGGLGFNSNNNNSINVPHLDNIIGFDSFFGDEFCCATSLLPEFKPVVSLVAGAQNSNLGMQSNQMHGNDNQESNMMKVGRYSEEERKERIVRYLKKRNQRNFNKTIKYACRKTLADRRVRVRGRFARNSELICDHHDDHDQQLVASTINGVDHPNTDHKDMIRELCFDHDAIQIKCDEDEDWLQNFALCC